MATIEDVLEAVGQLGERLAAVEAGQRELHADQQAMRADQRSLHAALEDQGRELRHHFDHSLALAIGGLREYVERRFDSLDDELAVVSPMASRLDGADQDRRADVRDLLSGLQTLRRRVDRLEKLLGDAPPPAGGPATPSPPPAR